MHAAVLVQGNQVTHVIIFIEYHDDYKSRSALEKMRGKKTKLREEDQKNNDDLDRIIICHITKKEGRVEKIGTRSTKEAQEDTEIPFIDARSYEDSTSNVEEDKNEENNEWSMDYKPRHFETEMQLNKPSHQSLRRSMRNKNTVPHPTYTTLKSTFQDHSQKKSSISKNQPQSKGGKYT